MTSAGSPARTAGVDSRACATRAWRPPPSTSPGLGRRDREHRRRPGNAFGVPSSTATSCRSAAAIERGRAARDALARHLSGAGREPDRVPVAGRSSPACCARSSASTARDRDRQPRGRGGAGALRRRRPRPSARSGAGADLILMTGSASWNEVFPHLLAEARRDERVPGANPRERRQGAGAEGRATPLSRRARAPVPSARDAPRACRRSGGSSRRPGPSSQPKVSSARQRSTVSSSWPAQRLGTRRGRAAPRACRGCAA